MPSVERRANSRGFLVAPETGGYGTGTPALAAATDGVMLIEDSVLDPQYEYDGARAGTSTGGYAELPPVAPAGRWAEGEAKLYWRGPGAAYAETPSVVASNVHDLLQGLGMLATFTTKWRYTLLSSAFPSLVVENYFHGLKANLKGAYCTSLEIAFDTKGPPVWTFGYRGIMAADAVDASVPAITYNTSGTLATGTTMAVSLTNAATSVSPRVMKGALRIERVVDTRGDLASGSVDHPGFDLAMPTVTLDLTLESTTQETVSPYLSTPNRRISPALLYANNASVQAVVQIGTGALGRFSFGNTGEYAYLTSAPTRGTQGSIATEDISLKFFPQTDAGTIDFYLDTD